MQVGKRRASRWQCETQLARDFPKAAPVPDAGAIKNAEAQIEAIEQAYAMIEGYSYELEAVAVKANAAG